MTPNLTQTTGAPKMMTYLKILIAIELTRFAGLAFLMSPGNLPAYFATPFGIGDVTVAIGAVILLLTLGKGGKRLYGLTVAWTIFGLADGLLGLMVSGFGGVLSEVSAMLGPGLLILPIDLLIHVVILGILMTKSVSQHMTK